MEPLSEELIERIDAYIEALFVPEDPVLVECLEAAEAAGLPAIQVSPNQGKLLYLIAKISRASRILEIGALAGYSGTWLGRALPEGGRLITIERDLKHAKLTAKTLANAGLADRTEVRTGAASELMRRLIASGEPPFDLIFIDADKPGYLEYLELSLELSRPGTVILADNVIRHGGALEEPAPDENAAAVRAFNAKIASHPRLESIILPIIRSRIDGLSISIVRA